MIKANIQYSISQTMKTVQLKAIFFLLFKSLILLHLIRFKDHLSTVHFSTFKKKKRTETTRKGNLCMKKM